ncbi:hypothetical protein OROGR_017842 [Orobanche gracilis]
MSIPGSSSLLVSRQSYWKHECAVKIGFVTNMKMKERMEAFGHVLKMRKKSSRKLVPFQSLN